MNNQAARITKDSTGNDGRLYVAFELSKNRWEAGFQQRAVRAGADPGD